MNRPPITYSAAATPRLTAPAAPGDTAAEHIRATMQLLLTAERGRAIATAEPCPQCHGKHAGACGACHGGLTETIRLGMVVMPDVAFRAIGERLLAALAAVERAS